MCPMASKHYDSTKIKIEQWKGIGTLFNQLPFQAVYIQSTGLYEYACHSNLQS